MITATASKEKSGPVLFYLFYDKKYIYMLFAADTLI